MYTGILLCRRCAGERGRAQEELLNTKLRSVIVNTVFAKVY